MQRGARAREARREHGYIGYIGYKVRPAGCTGRAATGTTHERESPPAGRRREADLLTEALPARRTGAARRLMVVAMAFMVVRVVDFTIRCFGAPSEWSSAGDGDG